MRYYVFLYLCVLCLVFLIVFNVHLISGRGSVSDFWEEGTLGVCVQGSRAVEDCRGWGFSAMHR